MHQLSRTSIVALLALAPLSLPAEARAQQQDEAERLLRAAIEDYDLVMLEEALAKLERAALAASPKGPLAARVLIMLGIVRHATERDEAEVESAFVDALRADPSAAIPAVYATPELERIMRAAKASAGPTTAERSQAGAAVDEFAHVPIKTAPANEVLAISATVPESLPVFQVHLYHRRFNEPEWTRAEMSPTSATTFLATIPPDQVRTSQLDYYIEALDRGGTIIDGAGSAREPITIAVLGSTSPPEVEQDLNEPIEPIETAPVEEGKHIYLMLGAGSGVGLLTGGELTAGYPNTIEPPGLGVNIGFGALELGWIINTRMRLGLYARFQFAPQQTGFPKPGEEGGEATISNPTLTEGSFPDTRRECLGTDLSGDCLVGLKYRYYLSDSGAQRIRFYSSVGAGVGLVRNWVETERRGSDAECAGKPLVSGTDSAGNPIEVCKVADTVRTGWAHFSLGAGLTIPLAEAFELVVDSSLMLLTLDQTSVNLDATLGFNLRF